MRPRSPDILVLTPRGGVFNHRYVVAEGSPLDASGCGRLYRAAKDCLGDNAVGCGRLDVADGGSFAAARHVVAQQETAGRRGAEWMILVDPRVGVLDESKRKRLQRELEERLSRLSPEVLDRIPWNDHAESDVIPDPTLEQWRWELAPILADVRPPEEPTETQTSTTSSGAKLLTIAAMVTVLAGIFIALLTWLQPDDPGKLGRVWPSKFADALLDKAAATLVVQPPTESKVTEQLARLFSDGIGTNAAPGQSLKAILEDVRRSVRSDDQTNDDLLKDEQFWIALKTACPRQPAPPDLRAFLSREDVEVVGDISDPKYVRRLAKIACDLRELDPVEAKPDDANLVPLFKSIKDESESIKRIGVDESLRIFTRADVERSRRLFQIFQNEDVKRVILEVRVRQGGQESLGAWMRTLGSAGRKGADGLFGDAYFKYALIVAEEKESRPKQRCIELLREFCATCVELVQKSPARPPALSAPTGVGQPRTVTPAQ